MLCHLEPPQAGHRSDHAGTERYPVRPADAGLDYAVKVIDRARLPPSIRTRADFGTMGMSPGAQYEVHHLCEQEGLRCRAGRAGASRRHSAESETKSPARANAGGLGEEKEGSASPTQTADAGVARGPRFS